MIVARAESTEEPIMTGSSAFSDQRLGGAHARPISGRALCELLG